MKCNQQNSCAISPGHLAPEVESGNSQRAERYKVQLGQLASDSLSSHVVGAVTKGSLRYFAGLLNNLRHCYKAVAVSKD